MKRTIAVAVVLLAGLSAGCTRQANDATHHVALSPSANPSNVIVVPAGYHGRYRAAGWVLESPRHGPQLCHYLLDSYPPQCAGPDVIGWSWQRVQHESANGTSWGWYLLVGTFDGSRFTLTEPATTDAAAAPDLSSRCAKPPGGWTPVDPGKATQAALEKAITLAVHTPGYAGNWIDPNGGDNDPAKLVLNIRYTGDPAVHQAELRAVWGGALCLSQASRTDAELQVIQAELKRHPDVISCDIDVLANGVRVSTYLADAAWQRELDDRYGAGVVRVVGFLTPID